MRYCHLTYLLLLIPEMLLSADKTMPEVISKGDITQTILSLVFIIFLIIGLGWLVKRFNAVNVGGKGNIKIISGISVGNRERVMLIEADGKKILLGVTQHSIRTLHEYAETESFSEVLSQQDT